VGRLHPPCGSNGKPYLFTYQRLADEPFAKGPLRPVTISNSFVVAPIHGLRAYQSGKTLAQTPNSPDHRPIAIVVKVRPAPKDSGSEAREAPWRESKTAEPSDNILESSMRGASGGNVQ
jgi:hypothetical protein